MKNIPVYILCVFISITACAQLDNYLYPEHESSEVEQYYSRGKEAEAAQEWEQALAHYKKAQDLAKQRQGTIHFDNPSKNNYFTTFRVLHKAMNEARENINNTERQ